MRTITSEMLKQKRAYSDQLAEFIRRFPDGVTFKTEAQAVRECVAVSRVFDFNCAARNLLTKDGLKAYRDARAGPWKTYWYADARLLETYRDARARPWKTYQDAEARLFRTYRDARAGPWKTYQDADARLFRTYRYARAGLWKTYQDADARLLKTYWDASAALLKTYWDDRAAVFALLYFNERNPA